MLFRFLILALGTLLTLPPNGAQAAEKAAPKSLGTFGFWTTYRLTEGDQSICYMSLTAPSPQEKQDKKKPKKPKRGPITLMITQRPAENAFDVVSYAAGIKLKPASEATVRMGTTSYSLFTQGDTAWSRDAATDRAIAAAVRHATSLTFTALSAQNTKIADAVQLKGAAAAYKAIGVACGMTVEEPKKTPTPKKAVHPAPTSPHSK